MQPAHPYDVISVGLYLSWARAVYIVGQALAQQFPEEEAWGGFLNSDEFVMSVDEFAHCVAEMRDSQRLAEAAHSPQALQEAVESHFWRARTAVEDLAKRLGIAPEELVTLMAQA